MKQYYLLLLLFFTNGPVFSQTIHIAPGSNIYVSSGTLFSIDSLVLTPSAGFNLTGQNSETKNASLTHLSVNPFIKRVFHFLATTASFSGDITVYYQDAELNGIAENVLNLNVHNGTAWAAFTNNVTRDAVNNFVTTTGLINLPLNELTLANFSSPLPVRFTVFNAACITPGVQLAWKTAQEFNSLRFEVQRSADGTAWQVIDSVGAAGNSSTERSYTIIDRNAVANSFYRIVQYDRTGRSVISSILRSSCTSSELFAVYPNPVHDVALINININSASTISLQLYDAKGALVRRVETTLLRGVNQLEIDMKGLAAGLYNLSAQWGKTVKQGRIIKE